MTRKEKALVCKAVEDFKFYQFEPIQERLFTPDLFKREYLNQFMSFTWGGEGTKEFYHTSMEFWVYALFGFLENQLRNDDLELLALKALCNKSNLKEYENKVMYCKNKLKDQTNYNLEFIGQLINVYKMFDDSKRISFSIETTENFYSFFWETETGTTYKVESHKNK